MRNIIIGGALLLCLMAKAQGCSKENAVAFQEKMNKEYANPDESPLTKEDIKTFKSLDFYPIDTNFCVDARLVTTPNEKPFYMQTTTSRKPRYRKYGELHFTLKGKEVKLDVFQSMDMMKMEEYKDYLFLPFTDLTSGNGSYGGGRYVDLKIPAGNTLTIDFNTAYNPYCAYNHSFSCPVPPEQNDILVEIKAGVKEYKKH
ncbi:DUF1684 domain-containing protein [Flavobacterium rakeshii]|uniref:DUF1684 domain-containing protein n=1 Tax=Flavobacterium rakeshii TaxID=1038845 RepID=A0A6N8HDY0_9FLAO|nr:DUF1684 domain-containing protein [Flavobacterium rakeshii]MUV02968.1 DUF1684 domain-containing protein [Flavobacterium rakeshii]